MGFLDEIKNKMHLGQQGYQLPLQLLGETLGRGRGRPGGVLRL